MTNRFEGHILSAELCSPIKDVHISTIDLYSGEKTIISKSDLNGKYEFSCSNDITTICFEHPDYISKEITVGNIADIIRLLERKLIGYVDQPSYLQGEVVKVFVSSEYDFNLSLFRHGLEKKMIQDYGMFKNGFQKVPNAYFCEHGLEWKQSASVTLPDTLESGIYSLRISNDKDVFAIPLVINAKKNSGKKILVLANINTWISYNLWGGRSRYVNYENVSSSIKQHGVVKSLLLKLLPKSFLTYISSRNNEKGKHPDWIFKKNSIYKPATHAGLEADDVREKFTNHLAGGEWRLLAWLEREGYAYDVVSDWYLENSEISFEDYECVITSTHAEYWTKKLFHKLKDAHENKKVSILNLSGNTCYSEVVIDKDSLQLKGFFFHKSCFDESKLFGVRWNPYSYATAAPYKKRMKEHWSLEGVKGELIGEHCLNVDTKEESKFYHHGRMQNGNRLKGVGASGWESDCITSTAGDEFKIIAKGLNRGGGSDMVIRESKRERGGYFSASSILFTGSLLVDDNCNQIVNNVLKRFLGVRNEKKILD